MLAEHIIILVVELVLLTIQIQVTLVDMVEVL
jgi:hypothetical protein